MQETLVNKHVWIEMENHFFYDGVVKEEDEDRIVVEQQKDTVCIPFGTEPILRKYIRRISDRSTKKYLYCEKYSLPKRMLLRSCDMFTEFEPNGVYAVIGGYKHVEEYCDSKLFADVQFKPCGEEYTLDKDGTKHYLDVDSWYDAREYICVIVEPEE